MMSRGIDLIIGKLAADINAAQRAVAFYDGAYVLRDLRYGERRNLRHSSVVGPFSAAAASSAGSVSAGCSSTVSPRERMKLPRMPLIKRTVSGSSYPLASSTASLMDAAAGYPAYKGSHKAQRAARARAVREMRESFQPWENCSMRSSSSSRWSRTPVTRALM